MTSPVTADADHTRGPRWPRWPRWGWTAAGGAAVLAALILRFVTASPLWLDEALSVHIANGPMGLGDALRRDGHPGLYYVLLDGWTDLFGSGDQSVRAMSGVIGVLTLPMLWLAVRRYGRPVTVCTLLLAASSPFLIRYSTETRMYALVVLLVTAAWWLVDSAWQQPTIWRLVGVGVVTAALVHTHYWTFYLVAAGFVLVAIAAWNHHGEQRRTAYSILIAGAAGAATFIVWMPVFLDQLAHTATPWAKRARPTEVFVETLQGIGGNNRFEGETLGILLAFFIVLGVFAVGPARERTIEIRSALAPMMRPWAATAAGALGLGAAVAIATGGAFEARYGAIVVPFLLLLAGRGLAVLSRTARATALVLLVVLGLAISVDEARRTRSQGKEVATAINARVAANDLIVFCPDQVGPATVHYLGAAAATVERRAFPSGDGQTVDWRDYLDRVNSVDVVEFAQAADHDAADGAIWFVSGVGYRGIDYSCGVINGQLASLRTSEAVVGLQELFEGIYATRYTAR